MVVQMSLWVSALVSGDSWLLPFSLYPHSYICRWLNVCHVSYFINWYAHLFDINMLFFCTQTHKPEKKTLLHSNDYFCVRSFRLCPFFMCALCVSMCNIINICLLCAGSCNFLFFCFFLIFFLKRRHLDSLSPNKYILVFRCASFLLWPIMACICVCAQLWTELYFGFSVLCVCFVRA